MAAIGQILFNLRPIQIFSQKSSHLKKDCGNYNLKKRKPFLEVKQSNYFYITHTKLKSIEDFQKLPVLTSGKLPF